MRLLLQSYAAASLMRESKTSTLWASQKEYHRPITKYTKGSVVQEDAFPGVSPFELNGI